MKASEYAYKDKYASMVATTMCTILLHSTAIALKDPAVMGKNTYGYARMQKFFMAVLENYNEFIPAFCYRHPERDYAKDLITRKLREIYPDDGIQNFEELFPFAREIRDYVPDTMKVEGMSNDRK